MIGQDAAIVIPPRAVPLVYEFVFIAQPHPLSSLDKKNHA
jgi:hypothetical protein